MKLSISTRLIRYVLYFLLLFGFPAATGVAWQLFQTFMPGASPLLFIYSLTVVVAVILITGGIATKFVGRINAAMESSPPVSLEQFISLYKQSPVPYITLDDRGEIIMYNVAAVRLFKAGDTELTGKELADMLTHEDENALSVVLGRLSSDVPIAETEIQVKTATGDIKWVLFSVYASEDSDERLVSLVDITQQKIVDAAKSEFVSLATHQLRTPVAAVRWNVELLQRTMKESLSDSQSKYFIKINRNVARMIALINDFLSVSKLETGTFETEPEQINLTDFFNSVLDEYAQTIVQKRLEIQNPYEPENLPFTADPRLLHIIVSNLFSNAVKYTQEEGQIRIGYMLRDETLMIEVQDSGIGVPMDEIENLFTKFFRASNAQSYKTEGTGLGLYIVKESAEKLGGGIEVTSKENVGTKFTVNLPYNEK